MIKRWPRSYVVLGALLALAASPALAQSGDATVRRLERRIDELESQLKTLQAATQQKDRTLQAVDQRVQVLDRKVENQQDSQRQLAHSLPAADFNYKNQGGLTLKTQDDAYRFTLGGWIQADGRYYTTQSPGSPATFLIRRARPYLEGTLDKYYDFRLMPDFAQGMFTLQDAYADVHYFPEFRLRAGQFKEPVGLERWQDDRWNEFVERALPTQLVPDRDIGVQFHGKLWHEVVEYHLGVFNGSTDNVATTSFDGNNAKDLSGRIFLRPFANYSREALQGFGIGIAGTYGTSEKKIALDTYRTAAQNIFFQYGSNAFAAGNRYRYSPQFYYHTGPLGLLGEFVYNSQEIGATDIVKGLSVSRTRQISNYAWNISANYVLTGERASFDGITPLHNFNPKIGDWGALEAVARVDQLVVDRDVFNNGFANPAVSADWALEWSIGLNWWLSRRLKLQTDYSRTTFHQGAPGGGTRKPESAFLQELQILF